MPWKGPFPFVWTGVFGIELPLEAVQLFSSDRSDRNSSLNFEKPGLYPTSLHLCREFGIACNKNW